MTTSIIIPTKNRPQDLEKTFPTLLSQTIAADEIVIVDQSEDDGSKNVVERFSSSLAASHKSKPEISYCCRRDIRGAAAARNVGIDVSTGDVLVFLDDDVLLDSDFLESLLAAYQQFPEAGGVSGVVINYPKPAFWPGIIRKLFWIGPFHDERQPVYWNCDRLRNNQPLRVRKFGGGVMSVKRSALGSDRFDSRYLGAGSEDVEFSWRVSERHPLIIAPRARLFHAKTDAARPREHWLAYEVRCSYYLYLRLWNSGIWNRLCFAWLNLGYSLIATSGALRTMSLDPWRAFLKGARGGRELVFGNRPQPAAAKLPETETPPALEADS